ncbi:MAG: chlorite dismutase family protein [Chloroflexi bacterium]|nr:chlorite dismutase family protein [Chloroflexota bacterium]
MATAKALISEPVVQFVFFKLDPAWRRLDAETRADYREQFLRALGETKSLVPFHSFSLMGIRADADFMLWRSSDGLESLEETLSRLLTTDFGKYLEVSHSYFGLLRRSTYGQARTEQDHAEEAPDKQRYFILYPFTKTVEWYLFSREDRGKMMGEHIKVGRAYPNISQILLYSTGLGDQEFVVGYESESLAEFQDLVTDLRSTEARRHTLQDTPIFTCVHRSPERILELLG